ncbi:pyrimidine 5'-nucleotidase [Psychromonas sp. Urea-02u-13]|uniref:pyrimidine 5'-nucleotidase n=1 Tax=Psychromonas sp. Urea-02u-13 TaxID=2058326 RepID=UPI000C3342A7|nr:pyrimidine 5'-nucleotidase [Psychromonas sp. Urea-02u-13]PKG38031.1 pyrimidine 5'-nucleotidase [Psychromonas sp. Urea-02u-13]
MNSLLERDVHLFDLDNTLYHPKNAILEQIGPRMRNFISHELGISLEASSTLCSDYYFRYGGTIRGIQLHYPSVDLNKFSEFSHQVELDNVEKATKLKDALHAFKKSRYVFTNSPLPYATRVLKHIDLYDCFDGIFSVELTGYKMKPDPHAFNKICQHFDFEASDAAFYDDQPSNIATAKKLGMRTILVNRDDIEHHDACYKTEDLPSFVASLIK